MQYFVVRWIVYPMWYFKVEFCERRRFCVFYISWFLIFTLLQTSVIHYWKRNGLNVKDSSLETGSYHDEGSVNGVLLLGTNHPFSALPNRSRFPQGRHCWVCTVRQSMTQNSWRWRGTTGRYPFNSVFSMKRTGTLSSRKCSPRERSITFIDTT